ASVLFPGGGKTARNGPGGAGHGGSGSPEDPHKNGIPESCRGLKGRAGKDHTDFAAAEDGGGYPGRMDERGSAALPDPGSDRKRKDPGVYGADRTGAFSGKTGDLSDPGDRSDLSDGAALLPEVW